MPRSSNTRRTYVPSALEVIAIAVARLLYRVRSSGTQTFPATGGVVLIANHLSYVDVVVLQLACPRPLRFIGYRGLQDSWFFDWVFRITGVIAITSQSPTEAIRRAVKALEDGEVVCVFPEGHISRTGELMEIKKGFEVMARRAKVPVVPAFHDGLWGSIFSFAGNIYIWKQPRLLPTPVFVAFGAPIFPEALDVVVARRALLDLGEVAFAARPGLRRHVGREVVRALVRRPGRIAVVDRTAGRRELSAGALVAASMVLGRRLRSTVASRRVGIVLPPGAGAFIANLGVMCAGKIPVNLNFTAGRASLEASLARGEIDVILSADAMRARLPDFPWPARTLDVRAELAAAGGKRAILPWLVAAYILPNQWFANLAGLPKIGDDAEAGLLFTSGSAGEPKGVPLTHRNILANCAQVSSLSILPTTASLLGCLPIFHSFGFTVTLWYPLLRGLKLATIPSPLDSRQILDALREEQLTVLVAAPTFVRPMLKKARPGDLRFLDMIVTGAEKLPQDLYQTCLERFHLDILQGYGLTETSPVASVNQPNPPIVTFTGEAQLGKRAGSVGRILPGMTARIVHPDTGEMLPETSTGMLWFRGPNIFSGYLGDPAKTAAALRDGWFVTGDLARFDADGFLYIEGRLSRFSKIGGEMVPHGTIEQKLVEAFAIDPTEAPAVAVVGVPDAAKGESLVLITRLPLTAREVRDKLDAAGLPALWIPREILRVEKIPMLGTGKLDLAECRRLALAAA